MTVPFRVDPESGKRPAQPDPFLEFASERPSKSILGPADTPRALAESAPLIAPAPDAPPIDHTYHEDRRGSAINPSLAFAIGVAGVVMAVVGYYQLGQFLSDRAQAETQAQIEAAAAAAAPAPPPAPGRLDIASDPAGASVTLDGAAIGVTPLSLEEIKPGLHEIILTQGPTTVTRTVELSPGGTAVVTAVLGTPEVPAASASNSGAAAGLGWVTFDSPIELRVLDRGRLRGSTRSRVNLGAGTYELELVSDIYEVRQLVPARVGAGRGTRIAVPLPSGTVSINAIPWADVWVDGTPVGTTPLANLALKVGSHEVVFRHPTLGERRQTVMVKATTPARLGVDLSR
jgi:hypothetical protein